MRRALAGGARLSCRRCATVLHGRWIRDWRTEATRDRLAPAVDLGDVPLRDLVLEDRIGDRERWLRAGQQRADQVVVGGQHEREPQPRPTRWHLDGTLRP